MLRFNIKLWIPVLILIFAGVHAIYDDINPATGGENEYELSMCMDDLVSCLELNQKSKVCSVNDDKQIKVFDNLCEMLYSTCAGHGVWHISDEASCFNATKANAPAVANEEPPEGFTAPAVAVMEE